MGLVGCRSESIATLKPKNKNREAQAVRVCRHPYKTVLLERMAYIISARASVEFQVLPVFGIARPKTSAAPYPR